MPTVHASFQTPKNVGNVEVVENVRVDVTEPSGITQLGLSASMFLTSVFYLKYF